MNNYCNLGLTVFSNAEIAVYYRIIAGKSLKFRRNSSRDYLKRFYAAISPGSDLDMIIKVALEIPKLWCLNALPIPFNSTRLTSHRSSPSTCKRQCKRYFHRSQTPSPAQIKSVRQRSAPPLHTTHTDKVIHTAYNPRRTPPVPAHRLCYTGFTCGSNSASNISSNDNERSLWLSGKD